MVRKIVRMPKAIRPIPVSYTHLDVYKRQHIQRAAGLGTGARQALAAEGLHADHRADDVAVDVDVAGMDLALSLIHI